MSLLLTFLAAHAAPAAPVDAVTAFVSAGDTRDVAALDAVLHPEFRVVAAMPDGVSVLPRAVYLDLIRGGKIGGTPRTAALEVVHATDDLATVKGTLDSTSAHFDCVWTVARSDGAWQLLQDTAVYVPKAQ